MEIISQKTTYEVRAEEGGMTLSGTVSEKDGKVVEANLSVNAEGKSAWYNRNNNGSYSESINGDSDIIEAAREFCVSQLEAFESSLTLTEEGQ